MKQEKNYFLEGTVTQLLPNTMFRVEVEEGRVEGHEDHCSSSSPGRFAHAAAVRLPDANDLEHRDQLPAAIDRPH